MVNVGRAVCMAFHPDDDYENMQVDHIDCNPTNNNASNLRWTSRKFNNSRKHTKKMKSMNAKHTSHRNEILKGTCNDVVMYFKNGIEAAKYIGCSHVLVYNSISNKFVSKAKNWKLEWISRDSDECKDFIKQIEEQKLNKKAAASELKKQKKIEYRNYIKKMKDEYKQQLLEQKAKNRDNKRISKLIADLQSRLSIWHLRLTKLIEQGMKSRFGIDHQKVLKSRIDGIKAKIEGLEQLKLNLEEQLAK